MLSTGYAEKLYPRIKDFEPWLLAQAKGPKILPVKGGRHNSVTLNFLARVWLEQLSIRRCVWCWNVHTGHSHALWKIYGQRGVALVSSIAEVKASLAKAGELRAIVSPVSYAVPPRFSFEDILQWEFEMNQNTNLAFPYLFKESGYKYEAEVRFVFGVHPNLLANAAGIVAEIDGKSVVQSYASKLWISPDIPEDEKNVIRYLIAEIRKSNSMNFSYPHEKDTRRLIRFKTVGGNPFTNADEPIGLFTDLD
jgi:hypothetical protein